MNLKKPYNQKSILSKFGLVLFVFIYAGIQCFAQSSDDSLIINKENIIKHTYFLGSDRLEGRGTGTEGENKAAEYISHLFHEYDLLPVGDRNSYFQNVPMHGSKPSKSSRLVLYNNGFQIKLELEKDYLLYKTGAETFIPDPIPLVFVGYGIIAPEFDYNDYQNFNVQGKVVVFLSGEPYSEDPYFFNGSKSTIYSSPDTKQKIALSRGAVGIIKIPNNIKQSEESWEKWTREFSFEHSTLVNKVSSHMSILINPKVADNIFVGSTHSFEEVLDKHQSGTVSSYELNARVSFEGKFDDRDFIARNVLGLIEGSDSNFNDSYLLLSAHYDHLGVGPAVRGDAIYNGVLDNALGVSTLLEIARVLATMDTKPRRSIMVLFLTGEEKGLLGSKYYTEHPVVPLYKTVANINIDGIAAFDEFIDVVGVGSEYSSLEDDMIEVLDSLNLSLSGVPQQYFVESQIINGSDQFSFMKAGIPSVSITEGLRYKNTSYIDGLDRMLQWNNNVYHSPFDDLDQPLNFEAAQQHAQIIIEFARFLADKSDPPVWKPGVTFLNARLRTIAEKR